MKEITIHSFSFWTAACLAVAGASFGLGSLQAQPASLATTSTTSANGSAPGTLPPFILPSSPVAQVVRLVQAGVDESIILSFVSNSASTFNLDSDRIIYLSDVGVPGDVTTAMMQRDQVLQQQMTAAAQPPQPPQPPPPTSPPPPATTTDTTDTTDATQPPPPDSGPITVNYFYTSLASYGGWVQVAGYGPCWRPSVGVYNPGWQPYCDRGHWVDTDSGWYWDSDYAWGTTFHYGRWFHHPHLGWCWWPDTVWAPSWVTWRYSDDYCGWAPIPPFAIYQPGLGFTYRGNGISVGFDFGLDEDCFIFVPTDHFCDPQPRRFRCGPDEASRAYHHTEVINNLSYSHTMVVNNGIPRQHFDRPGSTPVRQYALRDLRVPPTFTQHPMPLRPVQPGQGYIGNYSNNHPGDRSPGQNSPGQSYAPRPGGTYQPYQPNPPNPGDRTWTANPGSSQPGVYNGNYNNNNYNNGQRNGAPGQAYNHVPPPMVTEANQPSRVQPTYNPPPVYHQPQPPQDTQPSQVYRQPAAPQYTPPSQEYHQPPQPEYRQPAAPAQNYQPPVEHHEPAPEQRAPEPSQPRVEPAHNDPAPAQRAEQPQQQQSSGSGHWNH